VARAGTKPGRGTYVCSRCGATQELRTRGYLRERLHRLLAAKGGNSVGGLDG